MDNVHNSIHTEDGYSIISEVPSKSIVWTRVNNKYLYVLMQVDGKLIL